MEVDSETIELLSLPDLVLAKKTQRDKDWPMIRRLMEQAYYATNSPTNQEVDFLLAELRSPDLILGLAAEHSEAATRSNRKAVRAALRQDPGGVDAALHAEQQAERLCDQHYWNPLKKELEQLRRLRR